tara:strand:- start:60 stop:323 length:264 start_codon:yes stop_codon:yes gene_type:complete
MINIITRISIAAIAGYTYFLFLFKKKMAFFIKYTAALIFYLLVTYAVLDRIIAVDVFNIVTAKLVFDIAYSLIVFILFTYQFSYKVP